VRIGSGVGELVGIAVADESTDEFAGPEHDATAATAGTAITIAMMIAVDRRGPMGIRRSCMR
jgi:hypothetical protein